MERKSLQHDHDYLAPDGSEVRLLVSGTGGGMAHFRLAPGELSEAKAHRTVEELWYFVGGRGEMCVGDETTLVHAGVSLRIPPLTRFQFLSLGPEPLEAVGITMPPWPGPDEAQPADAYWQRNETGAIEAPDTGA